MPTGAATEYDGACFGNATILLVVMDSEQKRACLEKGIR